MAEPETPTDQPLDASGKEKDVPKQPVYDQLVQGQVEHFARMKAAQEQEEKEAFERARGQLSNHLLNPRIGEQVTPLSKTAAALTEAARNAARVQTNKACETCGHAECFIHYDQTQSPLLHTKNIVWLVEPKPGDHVLDLGCAFGDSSYAFSERVGADGSVTSIDHRSYVLDRAKARRGSHELQNITFYQHSITDLSSLEPIEGMKFDIVSCCTPLILVPDPVEALTLWTKFLKPEGKLIVNVQHYLHLTCSRVLERVGQVMGKPIPWYSPSFSEYDEISTVMEAAGLELEWSMVLAAKASPWEYGFAGFTRPSFLDATVHGVYDILDADRLFNLLLERTPVRRLLMDSPEVQEQARAVFRDEWVKNAQLETNSIRDFDGLFCSIAYFKGSPSSIRKLDRMLS